MIRIDQSQTSADVSFFRALYCGVMAITVLSLMPWYAAMHREFVYSPTPLLTPFGDAPIPYALFLALGCALALSLAFAALGIATRAALLISAVLYFVFFAVQLGFTKPLDRPYAYHIKNLGVFILAVLAFAPGVARHTARQRGISPAIVSAWPKVFILIGLGAAYFGSGYCKMVNDPLWVDGHTSAANILRQHLRLDIGIALWIGQQHLANIVASVVVIFVELTFAIGVFTRLRALYIIAGLGLHVSIYVTMGVNFFPYFSYVYLIFLRTPTAREETEPAPRLPNAGKWALGLTAAALFYAPIFARWEAWPFSDYRVFTKRNHPERIAVLRYGGENAAGEFQWLSPWWQQELRRRHERTLSKAYGAADTKTIEATVVAAFHELPAEVREPFRNFSLTRRHIRPAKKDPSLRWKVKDDRLFEFDVPQQIGSGQY